MPRRAGATKRKAQGDSVYNDYALAKVITQIMLDGKKSLAEKIVYDALEIIRNKTGQEPIDVFHKAMDNVMPVLEVKARRVGGANYQVPIEVRSDRRLTLAVRWIVGFARQRGGKSMEEKLAAELMEAAEGMGSSVKKKEDTHRMAEANKAFAHYRW